MKEVYVLYGRKHFHEGVCDHDGNYFEESPVVAVFDNFDAAKTKLREYAVEAYNNLKKYGAGYIVDDDFIKETTEEDLFSWYYMWSEEEWEDWKGEKPAADNKEIAWDRDKERYLSWTYEEEENWIHWQMYCNNVPSGFYGEEDEPILPGLKIKKCIVNS